MIFRPVLVSAGIALALTACSPTGPEDRSKELDAVYIYGQEARKQMSGHGVAVTNESCEQTFISSGHSEYTESDGAGNSQDPPKGFTDQRRVFYVNGCMDRPKSGTASVSPTVKGSPTPTSSPT